MRKEGRRITGVGKREKGKMIKLLWLIMLIVNLVVSIAMFQKEPNGPLTTMKAS